MNTRKPRPFWYLILAPMLSFALSGCANSGASACPQFAIVQPQVQLLYPIPGAKNVPNTISEMVFAGSGVAPIELSTGLTTIATAGKTLPSPLPSPAATPASGATKLFAVSFGALRRSSTYTAIAAQTEVFGCGTSRSINNKVGTFFTR